MDKYANLTGYKLTDDMVNAVRYMIQRPFEVVENEDWDISDWFDIVEKYNIKNFIADDIHTTFRIFLDMLTQKKRINFMLFMIDKDVYYQKGLYYPIGLISLRFLNNRVWRYINYYFTSTQAIDIKTGELVEVEEKESFVDL